MSTENADKKEKPILKHAGGYLKFELATVFGVASITDIANHLDRQIASVSDWLAGKQNPRQQTIAWMCEAIRDYEGKDTKSKQGMSDLKAFTREVTKAHSFLVRCDKGEDQLLNDPPDRAKPYLIAEKLMEPDGLNSQTAGLESLIDGLRQRRRSKAFPTELNTEPSELAEIESMSWNQMPTHCDEVELAAIVRYMPMRRNEGKYSLQFGLRQSMMRVVPKNFQITRDFCSEFDSLPGSFRNEGSGKWLTLEPRDNYGNLRGFSLKGELCRAKIDDDCEPASLKLEVYVSTIDFKLSIFDTDTSSRVCAQDREKAEIIEILFGLYLRKINEMNEEHTLLVNAELEH